MQRADTLRASRLITVTAAFRVRSALNKQLHTVGRPKTINKYIWNATTSNVRGNKMMATSAFVARHTLY
jgi:hypothetical protein